tara:strand:+ start:459 stop:788 length:330 start_codon:yes stop_codon:yes gene_type:complete
VSSAAALLGVTIRIVGWPMSLASVTFSPLSVVASNEGIGLFGAAPAHGAANRTQAVEAMNHMMEAAADIDLMKRMPCSACRTWRLLLLLFRCPCIKSLNCAVVMQSPHY